MGSRVDFVGFLSGVVPVTFVDIRPLRARLNHLHSVQGSVLALPYESGSVNSLSCLHVAEHVGLGRYGDPLDPRGTVKACRELARVLAPGGNLLFALPVGRARVCFNAHRVHSVQQILEYFGDLELVELSGVEDGGAFVQGIAPSRLDACDYGCGCFWFRKRSSRPSPG